MYDEFNNWLFAHAELFMHEWRQRFSVKGIRDSKFSKRERRMCYLGWSRMVLDENKINRLNYYFGIMWEKCNKNEIKGANKN